LWWVTGIVCAVVLLIVALVKCISPFHLFFLWNTTLTYSVAQTKNWFCERWDAMTLFLL
jgi:hypothetical protein